MVITVIVIPINRTAVNETDDKVDACPLEAQAEEVVKNDGIYNWDEQTQSNILGVFYGGYIISHLPGGILADKYGAKWVLGICTLGSGICTILSHVAIVVGGSWCLMVMRVFMGLAQGPIYPALSVLLAAWVPKSERGTLGTACYSGSTLGLIVATSCSGLLLSTFPWPVTFYVFGGASVIWFIIFIFLCTSSPMTHPCIKPNEMIYLMESIGQTTKDKPPIPWKRILLSTAMFGVLVSEIGHDWGYYVMVTFLPKYMSDVLRFSIKSNGLYTSLPYLAMWLASLASGPLADWLIRTGKLTITSERKILTFLSAFFPGLFIVIASYAGCNKIAVVTLFTISMLCMGPYYAGQKFTPMDMSPSYAGTIMAITNGSGALAGLAASPIVGALTPNAALREWRVVFIICFVILVISALVFCCFGTGEMQPYDPLYKDPDEKEEEKKK
ncbi:uncharacterized protein Dwil_GK15280 [Drosophila willistoni]|uniref:Major facilitator superfamily (MFS) profile domain-containing protein n=3 Tax=Drosophila willistoni TaxID=7260 RepID=B4MWF6_DROWI|nr:uncharacterized protein Dwil_GK15280 [Drosophila willistoni]